MDSNNMRTFAYQHWQNLTQLDILMVKIYIYAYDNVVIDPNADVVWHNLYTVIYKKEQRNNIFKPELFFKFLANFGNHNIYRI